ncbi:unnamed protein product, partial [Prorocentrum cordatum]
MCRRPAEQVIQMTSPPVSVTFDPPLPPPPASASACAVCTVAPLHGGCPCQVFCMLKTEANFGVKLKWDQIVKALGSCKEWGWLTQDQLDLYTSNMESMAVE